ncbi:hypothetical protein GWN42_22125 [candidate division KSB1 bacterium]|nr:hypothetical protein [Phycisphaerae bacterium]NIU10867.1 hypothetical protein [Phycisphaerae bacterium]NIV95414.1 hypothetical protein [candidate division KSB1 bacterium]
MTVSDEVLVGVAGIAITLIGFSGVVTALGRRDAGRWSPQEIFQLRTLVEPSIASLFSAFVALSLNIVIANEEVIWKIANGVCFVAHSVGITLFVRRGSTGGLGLNVSYKVGFFISMIVMLAMLIGMFSPSKWSQLTFLLGLSLGIYASLHNFYLLVFPMGEDSRK